MPRRSVGKSDSPVPRRQSARIAAASANKTPTPSPVKKTRRSKRDSSDKVGNVENTDQNGTESTLRDHPAVEEPSEKKPRLEEPVEEPSVSYLESTNKDESESKGTDASKPAMEDAKETEFEVVDKSAVPQAESDEVKEAISAQGEDGQLLVNYFQVTKDDVPAVVPDNKAPTSGDNRPSNGTENEDLCRGDVAGDEAVCGHSGAAESEQKNDETPAENSSTAEGVSQ